MEENQNKTTVPSVPEPLQEVSKKPANNLLRLVLIGLLLLVALAAVFYAVWQSKTTKPSQVAVAPSVSPSPTAAPRSKAPGVITSVVTSKALDPKTGDGVNIASVFTKTDKNIYLVARLKNAKIGTKIEYTRYLNNKFLDNRSITVSKANIDFVSFNWGLKTPTSTRVAGQYRVKTYTNGIFEKEILYTVE